MMESLQTISEAEELFARHLQSPWEFTRLPITLSQQYTREGGTGTPRILLNTSRRAWFAYALATRKVGSSQHYRGQQTEKQILDAFNQLSETHQETLAIKLANIEPHPTVKAAIEEFFRHHTSSSPTSNSLRTTFADEIQDMSTESASNNAVEQTPMIVDPRALLDNITEPTRTRNQQTASNPALERIGSMFSSYFRSAISTLNDTANISITFYSHLPDGLMSLAILPNKVPYVANELFGSNVEIEGELRYVQTDGSKMVPAPKIMLQGARKEAISQLFGEEMARAINVNPIRVKEIKQGLRASCVTMEITDDARDDAYVRISMEQMELLQIHNSLFR